MAIIRNYGTMSYTIGEETRNAESNVTSTELNVSYDTKMLKGASPTEFAPGNEVKYQVHIRNNGTGTFYNLTVNDNLGSNIGTKPLDYVADSVSAFLYDDSGNIVSPLDVTVTESANGVSFAISGTMPQGDYIVLTYHAVVDSVLSAGTTTITNTATFNAKEGGTAGTAYSDTASATINRETVTIVKSADKTEVGPGESLVYTFTLTNVGNTQVAVNSISDQLPANFEIGSTITATTGSTTTTYNRNTDFTVSAGNFLVLDPAPSSTQLTIPAASSGVAGVTTIRIPGTISA